MSKQIIVPKTDEAAKNLDYDIAKPKELIVLDLDQDVFDKLWQIGFFSDINDSCGCIIDEFEDEKITNQHLLTRAVYILGKYQQKQPSLHSILDLIRNLFKEAEERKTGIYFYF